MKTIGNWKYEVDDKNEVRIWAADAKSSDAPSIYQPGFPDNGHDRGSEFASKEEASTWAEEQIAAIEAHNEAANAATPTPAE
jgi:exo-beta-1,3-glucanase (GH17 family)